MNSLSGFLYAHVHPEVSFEQWSPMSLASAASKPEVLLAVATLCPVTTRSYLMSLILVLLAYRPFMILQPHGMLKGYITHLTAHMKRLALQYIDCIGNIKDSLLNRRVVLACSDCQRHSGWLYVKRLLGDGIQTLVLTHLGGSTCTIWVNFKHF